MSNSTDTKLQSHHICVRHRVESRKRTPYYCNFGVRFSKIAPNKGKKNMPIQPPVEQDQVGSLFGATGVMAYLLVIAVAIVGAIAKFILELRSAIRVLPLKRMVLKLVGNLFIAIFAALLAFWFGMMWDLGEFQKVIMIALSSFMGGHAINGFINIYQLWIKSQSRPD